MAMKEDFVNVCGVPTHILTWGQWIDGPWDPAVEEVAICITGNPGVPGFYAEWAQATYEQLGGKMPFWVIGHAGHDDPPNRSEVPQLQGNECVYDLEGQIRHKLEFITKYVPPQVKIHLLGHSIGAWMIVQLLRDESLKRRLKRCYMLFPTVERMEESPNGWIFTKIADPFYKLFAALFFWLLDNLPVFLRVFLIRLYFWATGVPDFCLEPTLRYTRAPVMEKVVFLARDEMARVRQLDEELIAANQHLLQFFYGSTDGWVPLRYYKEMRERFPRLDAELDTKRIDHAFVLRYSGLMASITADMLMSHSR